MPPSTESVAAAQRDAARHRANDVLAQRRARKRQIATNESANAARAEVVHLLISSRDPYWLTTIKIGDLLRWAPGVGDATVKAWLRTACVSSDRTPLRSLTQRQRELLADRLTQGRGIAAQSTTGRDGTDR